MHGTVIDKAKVNNVFLKFLTTTLKTVFIKTFFYVWFIVFIHLVTVKRNSFY